MIIINLGYIILSLNILSIFTLSFIEMRKIEKGVF